MFIICDNMLTSDIQHERRICILIDGRDWQLMSVNADDAKDCTYAQ